MCVEKFNQKHSRTKENKIFHIFQQQQQRRRASFISPLASSHKFEFAQDEKLSSNSTSSCFPPVARLKYLSSNMFLGISNKFHLIFRSECMREEVVRLSPERAARSLGEHHEGDRPPARQPPPDAFRRSCQHLVREKLRGSNWFWEVRADRAEPGEVLLDTNPHPRQTCRRGADNGSRHPRAQRVTGPPRGAWNGNFHSILSRSLLHVSHFNQNANQSAQWVGACVTPFDD